MKSVFNILHSIRRKFENNYLAIRKRILRNKCSSYLGLIRGYWLSLRGKVFYEGDSRPLIIGTRVDYDIWPCGSVVLTGKNDSSKISYPFDRTFPTASSIGMNPPFDHMNPPTLNKTRVRIREGGKLVLGPNTSILTGSYIAVGPNKVLSIGSDVEINHGVIINTICGLEIGKNVMIAHGAVIMDYDGHPIFTPENDKNNGGIFAGNSRRIRIEDNVWIGARAIILKGVTLGSGCIVATYSCVTSDVPPNSIVAGNPAKVIKENISWRKY